MDITGSKFLGFDLNWDYKHRTCILSMPDYIPNLLKKLNFTKSNDVHTPFPYTLLPLYVKLQLASQKPPTTLSSDQSTYIQKVTGSLLYLAHSLENLLLPGLNNTAIDICTADKTTLANVHHMLNYISTNPNPRIIFK